VDHPGNKPLARCCHLCKTKRNDLINNVGGLVEKFRLYSYIMTRSRMRGGIMDDLLGGCRGGHRVGYRILNLFA